MEDRIQSLSRLATRTILLAASLVILLWFLRQISDVLLLSLFGVVIAIVLNAPVTWLEQRRVHRVLASIIVFLLVAGVIALLTWLVMPRLISESSKLIENLPEYGSKFKGWIDTRLEPYPQVRENLPLTTDDAADEMPSISTLLRRATRFSLSLVAGVAAVLVLFAMVIYAVIRPRPLLQLYLDLFPPARRDGAARAFSRSSQMIVGWMWANIVVGSIEAVLVGVALGLLQVPAAIVWAALAFFAELVPKVGVYLMAIPPTLVALAVDPMTALWVALFYIAMNEIMSDFVTPRIRAKAMDLHPVSVLFVMLTMAAAFGLLGALIATPLTAIIKAYYEEFYPPARAPTPDRAPLVERMVRRQADAGPD